ncbi:hypothetical protein RBB50_010723 [Rhinocladiella similis]
MANEDNIDHEGEVTDEDLDYELEKDELEGDKELSGAEATTIEITPPSPGEGPIQPHKNSFLDQVTEQVLELGVFLAMEEFTDGQPASSLLVYFSGLLGLSRDGTSYQMIRNYTPNLAALIYYQRLVFLEWALLYRADPYLGRSRRPPSDHAATLQPIRARYTYFGCLAPLPEFISLLTFGRTVAHTNEPTF